MSPRRRRERLSRGDALALGVLAMLWLAVWLPRLHGPIDLRWDASVYYVLGTALAEGRGYRLLNEPGAIEAAQYPPLLPLVVAAHERALGTSDILTVGSRLRLTWFVLSGLYLVAAYAVVRSYLRPSLAFMACAFTALSFYSFLHPSDTLYAELPFALVAMLFLLCNRRSRSRAYAVATAALGVAAFLLRTAGVALLAAWVAESLLRRRLRQAAFRAGIAALPLLAWQAHIREVTSSTAYLHPAYSYQRAPYAYSNVSYAENSRLVSPFRPELGRTQARDLPRRVVRNLRALPTSIGESAWMAVTSTAWIADKLHRRMKLSSIPLDLRTAAVLFVGWGVLGGAFFFAVDPGRDARPSNPVPGSDAFDAIPDEAESEPDGAILVLAFGLTVALITLTPWPEQFWRYLAPFTPISWMFLIRALKAVGERLSRRAGFARAGVANLLVAAPLATLLLLQVVVAREFLESLPPVSFYDAKGREIRYGLLVYESQWHALDPALEWLRRHAGPDDIIAASMPHLAYLRSGRRAVLPPMDPDPERARRLLDEVPVEYVLLDDFAEPGIARRYAAPAVRGRPDQWREVYAAPEGGAWVYERVR